MAIRSEHSMARPKGKIAIYGDTGTSGNVIFVNI